jgi:hypothetical protein
VTDVRFIKIDVQGAELDVLRGCGPVLNGCLGLEVEVQFVPLYRGAPPFADIDAYLRGQGFTLWRLGQLTHYTERPPEQRLAGTLETWYDGERVTAPAGSGRLVWANALYFRDWRALSDTAVAGATRWYWRYCSTRPATASVPENASTGGYAGPVCRPTR